MNNSSSTLTQYNTIDFYKTATPAAGTVYISGITASSKDTLGVNALAGQLLFAASTSGTISGIAYLDTVLSGVRNTRLATGLTEMAYYSAASGSYGTHFTANSTRIGPGFDNALSAGSSSYRYSVVYAATGTINTSDINEKEQIQSLDDAEQRAAKAIKGLIKKFKWKDAVAKKGSAARIHVGVIAQEVEAVFLAEGLDPNRYGLFCKDVWWEKMDTDGLPGDKQALPVLKRFETEVEGGIRKERKGIRYDQLLAFVIAAV